jgi:hypothetical protein
MGWDDFQNFLVPSHEITSYSNIVLKYRFFAQLSFRVNLSGVLLLDITSGADPAVRRIVTSGVTLFDSDSNSDSDSVEIGFRTPMQFTSDGPATADSSEFFKSFSWQKKETKWIVLLQETAF